MSLYADYIKERLGDEIVETEHGFLTYRYIAPNSVYIIDLYIVPEARQSDKASAMADLIVEAAKLKGCTKMIGTVATASKTSTLSLKVLLGYGMRLISSTNEFLVFEKDI